MADLAEFLTREIGRFPSIVRQPTAVAVTDDRAAAMLALWKQHGFAVYDASPQIQAAPQWWIIGHYHGAPKLDDALRHPEYRRFLVAMNETLERMGEHDFIGFEELAPSPEGKFRLSDADPLWDRYVTALHSSGVGYGGAHNSQLYERMMSAVKKQDQAARIATAVDIALKQIVPHIVEVDASGTKLYTMGRLLVPVVCWALHQEDIPYIALIQPKEGEG